VHALVLVPTNEDEKKKGGRKGVHQLSYTSCKGKRKEKGKAHLKPKSPGKKKTERKYCHHSKSLSSIRSRKRQKKTAPLLPRYCGRKRREVEFLGVVQGKGTKGKRKKPQTTKGDTASSIKASTLTLKEKEKKKREDGTIWDEKGRER